MKDNVWRGNEFNVWLWIIPPFYFHFVLIVCCAYIVFTFIYKNDVTILYDTMCLIISISFRYSAKILIEVTIVYKIPVTKRNSHLLDSFLH